MKRRRLNGEGTVFKEESPTRRTRYRAEKLAVLPNGQRTRVIARGRTATEALQKLRRKETALADASPPAHRLTVREYLEEWLGTKRPNVRASTIRTYERDVRLHAVPAIGRLKLAEVTPRDVQKILTALQASGRHAQADKVRRTLKQAFRHAVKLDLLTRNPLDRLDPIRKRTPNRSILTPPQAEAFLREARGTAYHGVILTALLTGLRKGELIALRWRDVTEGGIRVARTYSRHAPGRENPPKTRRGERFVPLPPEHAATLEARRRAPDDLVFPSREGTPLGETNINRAMRGIADRAGVPRVRFHDLRRTYATTLARKGTHPRVIQALLGHATPHLALTVYTDVMDEQVRAAVVAEEDVRWGEERG